jgi:anti-sigma factor RsiW
MVTAAYGELAGESASELERHIAGCSECRAEREQLLALKALVDANPVLEPDANLVARSRRNFEEALDALPPRHWYEWLGQRMRNNFASLRSAPVAACLLLVAGAGAGGLGSYELAPHRAAPAAPDQMAQVAQTAQAARPEAQPVGPTEVAASAKIANISSIVRQPNSHMVEVRYNQMVPQRVTGSLDDPAIRQLLMLAAQNSASAGVRNGSVGLLAAECRAGHRCKEAGLRDALMVTLRYDKSAVARQKALRGLEPYVAEDVRVRNAILEALMNDNNAQIRNTAISILEPVEADTSVRQVLHTVANTDRNPYIRTVSRQVLDSVPEIQ